MTGLGYDVIGDIHGHHRKLEALLDRLGYARRAGGWVPPQGRQAVFVGDFIDRGPEQVRVCETVRSMVDAGHARAVMGNHEFNAIGYATRRADGGGEFLRPHVGKKVTNHAGFIAQVGGEGSPRHRELVAWFRTLPVTLDLGGLRIVHAWWHAPFVECVGAQWPQGSAMSDDFVQEAWTEGTPEWRAMDGLTKGLELPLPLGCSWSDPESDGGRREVRVKWWHEKPRWLADVALVDPGQQHVLPKEHPLPEPYMCAPPEGSPVFIGHYSMSGSIKRQGPKVACVDWSAGKGGALVAYRWDGEEEIEDDRFVAVD